MRLTIWLVLGQALVGATLGSEPGRAQQVEADPPDAYVNVRGPVGVSGDLPLSLADLPEGKYGFEARGLGLADARGHFVRDDQGLTARPWASALSMLSPPGLVHLRHDDPRGWNHLGAGAVSGLFWGLSQQAVLTAEDRIDAATGALAQSSNELEVFEANLDHFVGSAERDDETRVRNLWTAYFGSIWLGAGLEAWLFNPATRVTAISADRSVVTFPRATQWGAVVRSAVVPGGGQRYLGRHARASAFATLVTASAAGAILAQDAFLAARRDHLVAQRRLEFAVEEEDVRRAQAEVDQTATDRDAASRLRWVLTATAASFYAWNILDAFVGGGGAQDHAPPLSITPTVSGVTISLTFGFP